MKKSNFTLRERTLAMLKRVQENQNNISQFLHFPLKKLGKNESIFMDRDAGIFAEEFKHAMHSIIGKQLAVNTYYKNELIAPAGTQICVDLLKKFDALKINFKVMKKEVSPMENNEIFEYEMTQLIRSQNHFFDGLKNGTLSNIQNRVNTYINIALSRGNSIRFEGLQKKYQHLLPYLKDSCGVLTSEKKYTAIAAALNQIIENDRLFSNKNTPGETIAHIIKTSWISLIMAHELEDFNEDEYRELGLICLGHDTGKALIPQAILFKKGRLTYLENEIMKSHVLFSFLLASKNQRFLDFHGFAMGLHHVKEDNHLAQSYGLSHDTPTSFYKFLTDDARTKLDQVYDLTKKFYRVVNIADTFEAITASRIYKKPSSIGKALDIMVRDNARDKVFHAPYLDTLIKLIIKTMLPEKKIFRITDKILDLCFPEKDTSQKAHLKQNHRGVILASSNRLDQKLECMIFDMKHKKESSPIRLSPMLFLENIFL